MDINIARLDRKTLNDIPEWAHPPYSCKYCLYWEFPEEKPDLSKKAPALVMDKKLQWLQGVWRDFGHCGIVLYLDKKAIGYAQYAPGKFLPNLINLPLLASPDAIFLSCLYIFDENHRRSGFGTVLLNAVIEILEKSDATALETIARKGNSNNPSGPVEFYLENEFMIYKDHKEFSLMRLEL